MDGYLTTSEVILGGGVRDMHRHTYTSGFLKMLMNQDTSEKINTPGRTRE